MGYVQELETLLKNEVMPEVNDGIDEISEALEKSNNNKEDLKEELKYMQDVQVYFDEALMDIEQNNMTEEDACDILKALEEMEIENQKSQQ